VDRPLLGIDRGWMVSDWARTELHPPHDWAPPATEQTASSSRRRSRAKRASGNSAGTQGTSTHRCGSDGAHSLQRRHIRQEHLCGQVHGSRDRPAGARGAGM